MPLHENLVRGIIIQAFFLGGVHKVPVVYGGCAFENKSASAILSVAPNWTHPKGLAVPC